MSNYLKYGDKISFKNNGTDNTYKGEYLTLCKDKDVGLGIYSEPTEAHKKDTQDYIWVVDPAPNNSKKLGDYVESNDEVLLSNTNTMGEKHYLQVGSAGYGTDSIGFVMGIQHNQNAPEAIWRLSLNDLPTNLSESPQKISLDPNANIYIVHKPIISNGESVYVNVVLRLMSNNASIPLLAVSRGETMAWGVELVETSDNNNNNNNNNDPIAGDTNPRPIPGIPENTQFTITIINNEEWERTAKVSVDGKETVIEAQGSSGVLKAFKTTTGKVTVSLLDSQSGLMLIPLNISVNSIGEKGKTVSFGSQKQKDDARKGYMDLFIHIDWDTNIKL